MSARHTRVAIVVAGDGSCYPRLRECALDVVAEVPAVADLLRAPSHEHEVAIVGCTPSDLLDTYFQAQLTRLARIVPTVLVGRRVTRSAAEIAARARVTGLASRDTSPHDFARVVRSVSRGRVAYPPGALATLLRLVPSSADRRSSSSRRGSGQDLARVAPSLASVVPISR